MSQAPAADHNFPARSEPFDVVLIKENVNPMQAKPDDFKRIAVVASDPSAARNHEDVAKALPGHRIADVVNPGALSEPEQEARRRDHQEKYGAPVDLSKR